MEDSNKRKVYYEGEKFSSSIVEYGRALARSFTRPYVLRLVYILPFFLWLSHRYYVNSPRDLDRYHVD